MGVTTNLKLPYPELTDAVDGPSSFDALAQGIEDYFYRRIMPTGITRMPVYNWGSGSAYPSGAAAGDTFTHLSLGPSLMRWNGASWRQAEPAEVPNKTARLAISAGNPALLYSGFAVHQADTNVIYEWDGNGTWNVRTRQLIVTGSGQASLAVGQNSTTVPIAFGSTFAQPPTVLVTPTGSSADYEFVVWALSATTTDVQVMIHWTLSSGGAPAAGNVTFNWAAIGTAG